MAKAERKKRVTNVPENETAEQKTKRLTNFRVSRAIKDIGSIRNLAGASYTLSLDQKAEILVALKAAIKSTESAFAGEAAAAVGFQLTK